MTAGRPNEPRSAPRDADRPDDEPRDTGPTEGTAPAGASGAAPGRGAGQVGHHVGAGARVTARGVRGAARVTGRAGTYAVRQARRAANADGADRSGLNRLIYLHATNAAGDAAVAISLATTVFFAGAASDARGQVALFLGLTMLPFAIVAPLIGPFLDRFSHGRRWAIGATFALRAFLCWVLAGAVAADSALLYPAALGVLVASKAYGVTRAAAVPRLLPDDVTLVKANGRVSLAGIVGAAISAPLAGAAALAGADWSLRYAFLVFVVGTVVAILLPAKVDSSAGEQQLALPEALTGATTSGDATTAAARGAGTTRRPARLPPSVAFALRANCGPRWLSGFLTMFMAFLLREHPIAGWEDRPELLLGVVIGAAGLGNAVGILLASLLKQISPVLTVTVAMIGGSAIVLVGALFYGLLTIAGLGLVAGLAQALAKVSLDSTIQKDVPVRVQASAFARSDTTLQLAWVIGGFVGIALPLVPPLGLGVAFVVLSGWTAYVISSKPYSAGRLLRR